MMEMYSLPDQLYITSHWRKSRDVAVLMEHAAALGHALAVIVLLCTVGTA